MTLPPPPLLYFFYTNQPSQWPSTCGPTNSASPATDKSRSTARPTALKPARWPTSKSLPLHPAREPALLVSPPSLLCPADLLPPSSTCRLPTTSTRHGPTAQHPRHPPPSAATARRRRLCPHEASLPRAHTAASALCRAYHLPPKPANCQTRHAWNCEHTLFHSSRSDCNAGDHTKYLTNSHTYTPKHKTFNTTRPCATHTNPPSRNSIIYNKHNMK